MVAQSFEMHAEFEVVYSAGSPIAMMSQKGTVRRQWEHLRVKVEKLCGGAFVMAGN